MEALHRAASTRPSSSSTPRPASSTSPSEAAAYTIWFDDIQYETNVGAVIGTAMPAIATETVSREVGGTAAINGASITFPGERPERDAGGAALYYLSPNEAVATVDAAGVVIAVAVGSADITAKLGAIDAAAGKLTFQVTDAQVLAAAALTDRRRRQGRASSSNVYTDHAVDTWSAVWGLGRRRRRADRRQRHEEVPPSSTPASSSPRPQSMLLEHDPLPPRRAWSPTATLLKVKLVDFGANGVYQGDPNDDSEHELTLDASTTPAITTGQWLSLDLPLSSFTGLAARGHLAQLIISSSNATVYVDNVYFYEGAAAPTEPAAAAPTPTASAANVISLFSNAYSNASVDTWSAVWDSADVADVQIAGNDTKKYTALLYAGIEFTTAVIDASSMTHFHIDVWTPDGTLFKVKLVDFGANGTYQGTPNDDSEHELVFDAGTTPALTTGQWVSFDLPLSSFTNLTARAHLAQLIISSSTATVFVDNIYFHK
ncbi:MAG: hypothetical protein U1F43_13110 [Myxococcota bacterium]